MGLVSAKIVNLNDVTKKFKELSTVTDPGAILDDATAVILNRIRTRFLAEEGPDGPWVPSIRGAIRKAGGFTFQGDKGFTGTGTLFESGTLFHSIQAVRVSDETRSIQTNVPYAAKHQLGLGTIARPFMGINQGDVAFVEKVIKNRLGKFNGK